MEDIIRLSVNVDSFQYPDGTLAVSDISFEVKQGEFLGILGANGSGKTTLLKLIDGLMKDFKGNLYLDNRDIRKLSPKEIYKKVGLIFQNPDEQLFANTVSEDVAFGPINMGFSEVEVLSRVQNALDAVQMQGFAKKSIHNLSLGQKKRVCLAGLLAMGHKILLLDEPTASLDPMGISSIMHLLKDLNSKNNVTMIMSTHSVDLVPLFIDRVLVLDKGRLVKQGTPEEVFSDTATLRQANLRLTQIGHLFEVLKKKDGLDLDGLPLTIGEARQALRQFILPSQKNYP